MPPGPPRRTAPRLLHWPRAVAVAAAAAAPHAAMVIAPLADATVEEPVLAMDDIQGNVIPGFGTAHITLVGLRIVAGESAAARVWLRDLTPLITTGAQAWHAREVRRAVARTTGVAPARDGVFLNAWLSFEGAELLGLQTAAIHDGLFRRGMAAADLQDPADAAGRPIGWKFGDTPETTPHVVLVVGADDAAGLSEAVDVLLAHLPDSGFGSMYRETGSHLPDQTEHFGFRDGISQPGIRGRRNEHPESFVTRRYLPPSDPLSARFSRPGEPLLWPGQFILGYPTHDEFSDDPGPIAQPPEPWMRNGSFTVLRRLRQNVRAFRAFAADLATRASAQIGRPIAGAEIEALLVGRWPDGEPLVRSPQPPAVPSNEFEINHFDYIDPVPATVVAFGGEDVPVTAAPADVDGLRCPHFAHIRKVNLRDKLTDQGPSFRFRMLRRGIPYGAPFREDAPDDADRGLIFISYQRDLQQFMTVSATWMNSSSAPEGFGHDLLVGQHRLGRTAVRHEASGASATFDAPGDPTWITPTGGGFFFSPAVSVFASLA